MSPATSRPSTKKHCEPGVWPGRVDQRDRHRADRHGVARRVEHEVGVGRAGDALHAVRLLGLHVHLRVDAVEREELGEALDRPAAEVTADVVGVVVRDEHVGEPQAVGLDDLDELAHAVGRVDRDRFAGLAVADEVHEVHHLLRDLIVGGEVAAGEQLAEVEAVVVHGVQRKVHAVTSVRAARRPAAEIGNMSDGNLFDLTGKTAIVTGGGRGLGKAIALGLAGAGADVVVASRKIENCEAVAREIEALGPARARGRAATSGAPIRSTRSSTPRTPRSGSVDIVVNNAAMSPGTQLAESSPELFQKTYATNTLGPMWLASRCAERMREHGGGVIVNVVTTGAFRPGAGARPVLLVEGRAPRAHARDGQGVGELGRAGQRDRARPVPHRHDGAGRREPGVHRPACTTRC